jgi:hypothetical protein
MILEVLVRRKLKAAPLALSLKVDPGRKADLVEPPPPVLGTSPMLAFRGHKKAHLGRPHNPTEAPEDCFSKDGCQLGLLAERNILKLDVR